MEFSMFLFPARGLAVLAFLRFYVYKVLFVGLYFHRFQFPWAYRIDKHFLLGLSACTCEIAGLNIHLDQRCFHKNAFQDTVES